MRVLLVCGHGLGLLVPGTLLLTFRFHGLVEQAILLHAVVSPGAVLVYAQHYVKTPNTFFHLAN